MVDRYGLKYDIAQLKQKLTKVTKNRNYNFNHPDVISVSKELDRLIIQLMREKQPHDYN